ncbi:sigma-70 family RNA polymerase sigma factor [Permianibacter sp. IMCC34836]|uniref:ECF-type sigma factor n=1 Tax=Permianibacter fluminis TaxID=2738515 RepID=UPI0015526A74|nr:ECF-type sigma factor [Permianibacter fluminis]NQD36571.1 sigma-70 family RNA polymerase sigma factor [Permianibacter fluminis]
MSSFDVTELTATATGDSEPVRLAVVEASEFTLLLQRYHAGDDSVQSAMITAIHRELRRLARRQLVGNRWLGTLSATVLVNETYLRLVSPAARHVQSRAHFLNLSAKVMRQLICDYARRRLRERKVLDRNLDANEAIERQQQLDQADQLSRLDDALKDLALFDARGAQVIECRFFAGYSEQETAEAMGISLRTVERSWAQARAWLASQLDVRRETAA